MQSHLWHLQQCSTCVDTETDNFSSTEFDKMMFMQSNLMMGFLQESPPLFLQHLIPATVQQRPFLWAHLPHMQGTGGPSGLEIATGISGTIGFPFLTKQTTWYSFLTGIVSTTVIENIFFVFSCLD